VAVHAKDVAVHAKDVAGSKQLETILDMKIDVVLLYLQYNILKL